MDNGPKAEKITAGLPKVVIKLNKHKKTLKEEISICGKGRRTFKNGQQ